jgi:hypothetical protein
MAVMFISGHAVQVDECDVPLLMTRNWRVMPMKTKRRIYHYVVAWSRANGKRKLLLLHREIASPKVGEVIDHINHDALDNRRVNLRACTTAQNVANRRKSAKPTSSSYLGVYFHANDGRWRAEVTVNGRRTRKRFATEADAAAWRDLTASSLHGEFANLSRPQPALQAQQ